jgi:hypothetical protein
MFTFLSPAAAAAIRPVLFKTGEIAVETAGLVGLSAAMYFVGRKANEIVADGATEIGDAFDRTMERRLERRRAERTFRHSALNGEVEREIERRIRAGELIRATIIPPTPKATAAAASP